MNYMPNLNVLSRWIKNFLCVIGGVAVVVHGGGWVIRNFMSAEAAGTRLAEFPSPDGKLKAVLFNANGGGAIAPFCIDSVFVTTAGANANVNDNSNRVYVAGCHTIRSHVSNKEINGPELKWLSNDRLQIRFSANQGSTGVSELVLKGFALGGKVRMSYLASEGDS